MTDDAPCPFTEILDKRALGDSSAEDDQRLESHVAQGCPSCGPLFEAQASFEGLVAGAFRPLEAEVDARKPIVLERIKEAVAREEDRKSGRRIRRRSIRFAFYSIVLSLVVLLATFYIGYFAIQSALRKKALSDTARVEVRALLGAVEAYARERGELPDGDVGALVKALSELRRDGLRPYHAFEGRAVDPFGRPWIYEKVHAKKARLRSVGANGRDEQGAGDDLAQELHLVK